MSSRCVHTDVEQPRLQFNCEDGLLKQRPLPSGN